MAWSLLTSAGQRKYLISKEREAFAHAAMDLKGTRGAFCLTLAATGARISEVLALTYDRVDFADGTLTFETLKRREPGVFRSIPVPLELLEYLDMKLHVRTTQQTEDRHTRLWRCSRPAAWRWVKNAMRGARIEAFVSKPKALRHAFGVQAVQDRVALSLIQKWLGHAKIETTAIYATPVGAEERALARMTWAPIMPALKGAKRKGNRKNAPTPSSAA